MMGMVKKFDYGHVGIEWEGRDLSEQEGVMATKLLERSFRVSLLRKVSRG